MGVDRLKILQKWLVYLNHSSFVKNTSYRVTKELVKGVWEITDRLGYQKSRYRRSETRTAVQLRKSSTDKYETHAKWVGIKRSCVWRDEAKFRAIWVCNTYIFNINYWKSMLSYTQHIGYCQGKNDYICKILYCKFHFIILYLIIIFILECYIHRNIYFQYIFLILISKKACYHIQYCQKETNIKYEKNVIPNLTL